jgi:hypothetical protein
MACTHLILACLFEAITCPAKYRGRVTWLDEDILAALAESIPPLALEHGDGALQAFSAATALSCMQRRTVK